MNYINGVWKEGEGEKFSSTNPATGDVLWQGRAASASDVDAAISAAKIAFETWSMLPISNRMVIIERFAKELEQARDEMALANSREMGKTLWDSKAEMGAAIGKIAISLEAYRERTGVKMTDKDGVRSVLKHKPHGVLAVFGPYNFPVHLPNGHIVPALIAGNTVVLKPSEQTPMISELMIQCWERAGAPQGVINLLQGAKDTGVALAGHEQVNGILFTGSVPTGIALHKQCAGKLDKMLALELGGNNPLIVWNVSDLDAAAILMIQSAFISAGQRCTCARRIIVPKGTDGDAILDRFISLTKRIVVGAFDSKPEPFMGPLVSEAAANHAIAAENALVEQGAKRLLEMRQQGATKAFVTPGILEVTGVSNIPDEEIFAPLVKIYRAEHMEQAIHIANDTRYGLSAGIITDTPQHIQQFTQQIRAGVVAVNRPTTGASSALPFGGVGVSGNHRPSAYYAADYVAWPIASQESDRPAKPSTLLPGLSL